MTNPIVPAPGDAAPPSTPPSDRYKLPRRAPTAADIDDRDRFRNLSSASLSDVRGAAEKWRNGLAALVTLITGGLLIKGPESAADIPDTWRAFITLLAAAGIGAAIIGLWYALKAAAGIPRKQDFDAIVTEYGSVLGFEVSEASRAASALRIARGALMVALPLLGAAVIVWWWAPTKAPSPPAYVEVERVSGGDPICGALSSGDNGHLIIKVSGAENPTTIDLTDVANLRLKAAC